MALSFGGAFTNNARYYAVMIIGFVSMVVFLFQNSDFTWCIWTISNNRIIFAVAWLFLQTS